MSFDPKKFLLVSKDLVNGNTEAHYRSIINRAYYGVFGHIKSELSINVIGTSVHQEVINHLKRSANINHKKIGSKLEILFKKRKDADYTYSEEIKSHSSEFAIKEAEDILLKFKK